MTMISSQDLLRRQALFQHLPEHLLTRVAMSSNKVALRRQEVFIHQDYPLEHLFILLNGKARMIRFDEHGKHVVIARLSSGEPIGEIHLFDSNPASMSVITEKSCDALKIPFAIMKELLLDHPSMTQYLNRLMTQRLRLAIEQISSLALKGVVSRVANKLVEESVTDVNGQLVTPFKVSRQDLAYQVGASREMVSRSIKDLQTVGALKTLPDGRLLLQEPIKHYCK